MAEEDVVLNVAAFVKTSRVAGPGLRDVLWVQGCSIGCLGCGNPAFQPHIPRRLLSVPRILMHFRARHGIIDGLTVSGGEPTEQALAVAILLEDVHALGFSTVVYTGRVYEDLLDSPDPAIGRLLAATDLLIDGPFVSDLQDPSLRWRGSRNQRLLSLTRRLANCEDDHDALLFEVAIGAELILVGGSGNFSMQ